MRIHLQSDRYTDVSRHPSDPFTVHCHRRCTPIQRTYQILNNDWGLISGRR